MRTDFLRRTSRIIHLLSRRRPFNRVRLCEQYGVSARTISRDIDAVEEVYDLKIRYEPEEQTYMLVRGRVPAVSYNPTPAKEQAIALELARRALWRQGAKSLSKRVFSVLCGMFCRLPNSAQSAVREVSQAVTFRGFGEEILPDESVLELLEQAVCERITVAFEHACDRVGPPVPHLVNPVHLYHAEGAWYLLAQDSADASVSTYAVGRIRNLNLQRNRARFAKTDFNPESYLYHAFGIYGGDLDTLKEVIINFKEPVASHLLRRHLHDSAEWEELPNGGNQLNMILSMNDIECIVRWVRGFGTAATVIGPSMLFFRLNQEPN